MFSFLVEITRTGRISEVHWSDPETIVPGNHASIFDLFAAEAGGILAQAIKQCARGGDEFICETSVRLASDKSEIVLGMMPMDKHVLVFVAADRRYGFDSRSRGCMYVVRTFMAAFAAYSGNSAANIRTDMIQTLAKELISRKRQLQETNDRMNLINEDLNNRLVKDALTGLVSRYQYRAEIEYLIGKNAGKLGVFIFIDIDDFKSVNDTYGHPVGDKYLIEFAERLKRLDMGDMVRMRISGDEFGLFIYGLEDVSAPYLAGVWGMFRDTALSRPIVAGGYSLPITVSAGMSVYGIDTLDIYELVEYADWAMYRVKRKGKNSYSVFQRDAYQREMR